MATFLNCGLPRCFSSKGGLQHLMEVTCMNKRAAILSLVFTTIVTVTIAGLTLTARDQTPNSNVAFLREQDNKKSTEPDSFGAELSIEPECLDDDETNEIQDIALPSGQTLVGVCNLLLMLDAEKNVVWQYAVPQMLFDFAYLQSTGLIYGTAGDNNMFILEASSGKELVRHSRNGSAAYGRVKQYGNEMCLITDNNWGYRNRLNDP